MQSQSWQAAVNLDYCTVCATLNGLEDGESVIAWTPGASIRSGDTVIIEYPCRAGLATAYLKALRIGESLALRTRCGFPDFFVHPCQREASNGLMSVRITGVVRGAYRAF